MSDLKQRIYHIDALRCFCMIFGLAVHGATIGTATYISWIPEASGLFRMAAFFVVSGYFTAMMCLRSDYRTFLTNRSRMLLVPFVSALILLNPVTIWLFQWFHGGGNMLTNPGWTHPAKVWHLHLWFLISLFIYAALAPLVLKLAVTRPVEAAVAWLIRLPVWARMTLLSLLVAACVVLTRGFADVVVSPFVPHQLEFISQRTFNYAAFFMMGLVAYRHRALFDTMHTIFWPGLILFGALLYVHPMWAAELPRSIERVAYWFVRSALIFTIVCALLELFRRMVKTGSPMLSRLTDGVYTFYIFHFLVIYIIANLVHPLTNNLYVIFAAIMIIGYPLLFLIHEKLIAPSPLLTLLFNGKVKPRPVPAS